MMEPKHCAKTYVAARARVTILFKAAMKVKTGLIWLPERGTVTMRKRNAMMNTAIGTRSFCSDTCESKHEMMDVVSVNTRKAVATNSVNAALHI